MPFTLHVRNVRALRQVSWSPSGVSCLVGPNGAGKTTLFLVLKVLREAYTRGLAEAVTDHLGGSHKLRNSAAPESEPVELGLDVGNLSWRVSLQPRGATVEYAAGKTLTVDGQHLLSRDPLTGQVRFREEQLSGDGRLVLRFFTDARPEEKVVEPLVALLKGIRVLHDVDLYVLRTEGSHDSGKAELDSRGRNAFAVLRHWNERKEHRHRFAFVRDGLKAAFPDVCEDIDFEAAGKTVVLRVFRPGDPLPVSVETEAAGFIAMLVLLCAVAGTERGGLLAMDAPENALHPFAIREFLRRARQWAHRYDVTVLLATHSPVVLNAFQAEPERIYVMQPGESVLPVRLDEYRDRAWLANFELGELYSNCEFGATGT